MSSNLPSDFRKSSIEISSDYIERLKQQSNYVYKQRFQYEQSISFPPILGPSFNGGGSSDISPHENLTTLAGGYQFYESGGTIQQILPPSAFAPILTASLSIYQMGILLCSWDPHPNSTSYTIDFYETSFSGSPVYTYSPISGTTLYTAGEFPIQSGRRYGIRVKGVDEAVGNAVFSSLLLYSFTASLSVQRVGSLSCAWDARPGYTSFTIDFYETSFSTSPIYTAPSIVGTTFSTSGEFSLVSGSSYGISVRGDAEDPSGASYSSLFPYNFTATVSQPNTESIRIAWDAHPNVSTYTVRIDENTSGNTVWTYNTVSGTSLDTTGEFTLVNGSTYSAVVTGTGLGTSASVTSPFFTYTITSPKINLIAANYSGTGAWLDESGNGFNATLGSGTAAKNGPGNGIVLDGSTYWNFPNISAGAAWTVILWYKKTASSIPPDQYADILTQIPTNSTNLMIGNFGSSDIKAGFLNNAFYTSAPIPFNLGFWKNIAVTYDGTTLLTYINGNLIDTQVFNVPSADSGNAYRIGRRWDSPEYVVGEIGQLLIYPGVKTATTIQTFYTETVGNYPLSASITQSVYSSLHLSWDAHPGSTTYEVSLYTDPSGILVYTYSGITGVSINTDVEITLLNNTLYKFGVKGDGDASGAVAIFSPTLLSNTLYPSMTIVAPFSSFAISWHPAVGASTYVVQLYRSTTNSTVVPGTATLVYTYNAISGTSLATGVESTPVNGFYYFARVKVTGQASTSYKSVPYPVYVWGIGLAPLNITLSQNTSNDSITVNWTRDPSLTEPFTISMYTTDQPNVAAATYDVGTATSYSGIYLASSHIYYAAITLTNLPVSIAYLSYAIPYVTQLQMLLQGSTYSGSGPWLDQGPYHAYNPTLVQGVAQKNSAGNAILFDGATYWTLGQVQFPTYSFWIKTRGILPVGPRSAGGVLTQDYNPTIDQFVSCFVAGLTSFSVSNRWYYPGLPSDSGISVTTTDGVWNHILISNLANTGSGPRAWINGVYVGQAVGGVGTSGNGFPMSIGRETIGGNGVPTYFVGELGEIAAYQTLITNDAGANTVYNISKDLYIGRPLTSLLTQSVFSSLHFLWDVHPGSTSYSISLYTDPSGAAVYTYAGITAIKIDTGVEISLLNDTLYTIGVKGDGDASGAAAVFSPPFLTNTLYPSVALIPSNTALRLSWHPAVGASTYVVQLYKATTSATVLSGYTTLVRTYTAVSGTSMNTGGEITLVNASYYFIRVKVTGQTDASYKTAAASVFVWGGGTNLGLTLSSNSDGTVTANWSAASGVYQGYTISIYATADSSLVATSSVVSTTTTSFTASFFTIGVSYYATITLFTIVQSAPLKSAAFVYTISPKLLLRASTYSGSGAWLDESGNGYDATLLSGTNTLNTDGNGIVLDGATCWSIPTIPLLTWTVCMWYKSNPPYKNGQYPQVLTNTGSSGGIGIIVGFYTGSNLSGGFFVNNYQSGSPISLPSAVWTHIAVVRSKNTITTYVNGSLLGSISTSYVPFIDTSTFHLGKRWDLEEYVVGEVGELRIYGTTIGAGSIQALYADSSTIYAAPLVLLRASSYSGSGPWLDESGNGNNATVDASGTAVLNGGGNGIVLDGSTFWSFPNVAAGNSWTVGVWFKQTAPPTGNGASIVTQESSNSTVNLSIGYRWNSTTTFSGSFESTGWAYGSPITVTTGQWISVYVSWDGTNMRTYVNGSLTGTTQPGYTSIDSGLVYTIGKAAADTNYMISEIGEVRIYKRPLSATQIAGYFSATRSTFGI